MNVHGQFSIRTKSGLSIINADKLTFELAARCVLYR